MSRLTASCNSMLRWSVFSGKKCESVSSNQSTKSAGGSGDHSQRQWNWTPRAVGSTRSPRICPASFASIRTIRSNSRLVSPREFQNLARVKDKQWSLAPARFSEKTLSLGQDLSALAGTLVASPGRMAIMFGHVPMRDGVSGVSSRRIPTGFSQPNWKQRARPYHVP